MKYSRSEEPTIMDMTVSSQPQPHGSLMSPPNIPSGGIPATGEGQKLAGAILAPMPAGGNRTPAPSYRLPQ